MGKRIDAETRAQIAQTYLANEGMPYRTVAKRFGISAESARRIIKDELKAGNGIKPDRRAKTEPSSDWMQHITPLHKHKQALELAVEHKQAELDKAKQELRDFTATLRQLMEGDV